MRAQRGARLLPALLPRPWPATDTGRQAWSIGPRDSQLWTVLDGPPMPTDLWLGGSSPSERTPAPVPQAVRAQGRQAAISTAKFAAGWCIT